MFFVTRRCVLIQADIAKYAKYQPPLYISNPVKPKGIQSPSFEAGLKTVDRSARTPLTSGGNWSVCGGRRTGS